MWAVDRVLNSSKDEINFVKAWEEASKIFNEELENARKIGENGEPLFKDGDTSSHTLQCRSPCHSRLWYCACTFENC